MIFRYLTVLFAMLLLAADGFAQQRYQVAACDWMMLKRQKLGEFQLTKQIGADGVEMDMGGLGKRVLFDNKLRDPHFQKLFRHTADSLGVQVPSVAMSGFFAQNLIKRDNHKDLVIDCLNTMEVMGAKVAFLPLGGSGHDWEKAGGARDTLVQKLRDMGELAHERGMVIGIRTGLDAKQTIKLLKEIDSDGIKVYYNMQDDADAGRDICKEIKKLGKKRIVQIHASLTDSVTLDNDPRVDMLQVKKTLDKMGWSGWLVVERSRDVKKVRDVKHNFGTNVRYLKKVFQ